MKKKRRNKYGVSPKLDRTWKGKTYASKAECQFAQELDFQMRCGGAIESVKEQPAYLLTKSKIKYIADFLVTESTGYQRVIDVKGAETDVFKLKKRLWRDYGPPGMPLELVRKTKDGWTVSETVMGPDAKERE